MNIFNLSPLEWGDIFAGLQALFILIGFSVAIIQLRNQSRDSRTNMILNLMKMFREFDDIETAFRPGGKWENSDPKTAEDWGRIDNYLGLFEHCETLIQSRMIDSKFFKRAYLVQLSNLLTHQSVLNKLKNEYSFWIDLWDLCKRYDIDTPNPLSNS